MNLFPKVPKLAAHWRNMISENNMAMILTFNGEAWILGVYIINVSLVHRAAYVILGMFRCNFLYG